VSQDTDRFEVRPKVRRNRLPENPEGKGRFPSWLHRKLPAGGGLARTSRILGDNRLPTVCEEAKCPNMMECWSAKTATFLALGKACTRACGFCDIDFSKSPPPLEPDEPDRIADSVIKLGLKHVVITMVARDDLPDGGAEQIASIIRTIRNRVPGTTIEVLTSDFAGNTDSWATILNERPEIFNYNIETVRELSPRVRHKATYERTLALLRFIKENGEGVLSKSGLMVGLGESDSQVQQTLQDLLEVEVDAVTIGQYLQPNHKKLQVKAFVTPDQFQSYKTYGESIGLPHVYSGPFVRSSYNAALVLKALRK
jgi:lipoic acid synthetase